jgi:hypothetical protein
MSTMRDIARRALIALGVINPRSEPADYQAQQVLDALQAWILESPAIGLSAEFTNVDISDDYTAGENERIRVLVGTTDTVTLPESVEDADSVDAYDGGSSGSSTRPPGNGALVNILGADADGAEVNVLYAYIRSRGNWVLLTDLELDDDNPLGAEFDRALVNIGAVEVASNFAKEASPSIQRAANTGRARIVEAFDRGTVNQVYY